MLNVCSDMTMTDSIIHPEVLRLVQLFSALPEIRFPDIDAPALQELVARVKDRHLEVVQLEVQLAAAKSALDDDHEQLLKKTHRLVAWLTVLADTDEALQERLGVVTLPRLKRPPGKAEALAVEAEPSGEAPRKRGRPRKVPAVAATEALFAEAAPS